MTPEEYQKYHEDYDWDNVPKLLHHSCQDQLKR